MTDAMAVQETGRWQQEEHAMVPIIGRHKDGASGWYTGNDRFTSPRWAEAFVGYSLDGARRQAARLNRMSGLNGWYFVACVGDLIGADL